MERFSDLILKAKIKSGSVRFTELAALYKAKESDLLDPDRSPDDLYTEYNRRSFGLPKEERQKIAAELNGAELNESDFELIEQEAANRKQKNFDLSLLHQELKKRNLWQWEDAGAEWETVQEQSEEINALMDEIAGRKLTMSEIADIDDAYVGGYVGSDGEYDHTSGVTVALNSSDNKPQLKVSDKRGKPSDSYTATDHAKTMAETARANKEALEAADQSSPSDEASENKESSPMPQGGGWHAIPGGNHGGFRRKKGNGWEYWYPSGDHAAQAHGHHTERSENFRKKLGRALRNPMSTSEDLGKLLDAHIHHENEARRSRDHHGANKKGPHISSHEKSYSATWLTMFVKAKSAKNTPAEPRERKRGSSKNKKGSAKNTRGKIKFSESTIATLKQKVKDHNKSSSKKVTLGQLKAVYRRGAGAFSTSHHPKANRHSWSMGRVNSFLRRVKGGDGHSQDDDLIKADSYPVPAGVQSAARRGLELRKKQPKSGKAGLDQGQAKKLGISSGVARARGLASGKNVSEATIRAMHRYFSRHASNYKLDAGKKPHEDKGYVAGLLWGGEAGRRWAAKMFRRFEREDASKSMAANDFRAFAMKLYFDDFWEKAESYDSLDPHSKVKKKPPGGEEAGWQPMRRTRHSGWERQRPNGSKEYWYPSSLHAQSAQVSHAKEAHDARVNARTAQTPGHKNAHEMAADEHAQAAAGAKDYHEKESKKSPEPDVSDDVLHVLSSLLEKRIKAKDLKRISYKRSVGGKELMSITIKLGNTVVPVNADILEDYDMDLPKLSEFLESGGAKLER